MKRFVTIIAALTALAAGCGLDAAGTDQIGETTPAVEQVQQPLTADSCLNPAGQPDPDFLQVVDGWGNCWEIDCGNPWAYTNRPDLRQWTIPGTSWNWDNRMTTVYRRNTISFYMWDGLNYTGNLWWFTGNNNWPVTVEQIAAPTNAISSFKCIRFQ